jgi:hypothetical protein
MILGSCGELYPGVDAAPAMLSPNVALVIEVVGL